MGDNFLSGIDALMAGQVIADQRGDHIIGHRLNTEQLDAQDDCGDRGVGRTAEHSNQAQCGQERRFDVAQLTDHTAQ